jgi:O-antigen ligase
VTRREHIETFLNGLLIIAIYSALLAIHEQWTGTIVLAPREYQLVEYASGLRVLRSLWGSNSIFGSIFAFAIPVAFYRLVKGQSRSVQLLYAVVSGLLLLGMFLTYKRAAWISMLVSFAVIAPFFPSFRRVLVTVALLVSVPLVVYWEEIAASSLVEQRLTRDVDTLNGRTEIWQVAIEKWQQSPWFGHGFRSFASINDRYQAIENTYLHVLVSGGLLALIPFVGINVLALRELIVLYLRGPSSPAVFVEPALAAVAAGMISSYLIKAITGVQADVVNTHYFLIVGVLIGSQSSALALVPKRPAVSPS